MHMQESSISGRRYVLVLSGQVCREHSRDLHNFWSGFINIQRTVNAGADTLDVVAHSWSPEHDDLVRRVYAPVVLASERQPNFAPEYMPLIDPVDRFEAGLKRARSTWKRCSPQALLGNARSRSRAMALVAESPFKDAYKQVIAARWDQGMTGSAAVHNIVHDRSLPEEFLYMAYYSEIDEGYADMWFVAPPDVAERFAGYDRFVLDCLGGRNDYVDAFTKSGWPLSLPKEPGGGLKKRLLARFPRVRFVALASRFGDFARRKAVGLSQRIERVIHAPQMTGENAIALETGAKGVTWPAYQALNNHAILKYFVFKCDLRQCIRFLEFGDFQRSRRSEQGTLINPVGFPVVIYSHSSFADCWNMAVMQTKKNMPANCERVVLFADDSAETRAKFEALEDTSGVDLLFYQDSLPYTERLRTGLEALSARWPIVYFMHEDMPLVSPVDAYYLNALLHYIGSSNELYVKLIDTTMVDEKLPHPEFPGLVSNTGGYAISIQPALLKTKEFAAFLANFRCSIYEFEGVCTRSNFKASAVAGDRRIGKYLLSNRRFPHIATAISKGKWCVSEWPDEIRSLAEIYSIDIQKRGTV